MAIGGHRQINLHIRNKILYEYQGSYYLKPRTRRHGRYPDGSFEGWIMNAPSLTAMIIRPSFLIGRYIENLKELWNEEKEI